MNQTYSQQRKKRLSDSVFEYLSDDDAQPFFLYDLHEAVKENYDYFKKYADKCKEILDKLPKSDMEDIEHSEYYYDRDRNRSTSINNTSKKDWDDFWESL